MVFLLMLLLGCGPTRTVECAVKQDPAARQVPHVSWETPEPGRSWVEYTWEETSSTDATGDDLVHDAPILGVPPLTDVAFTAYTEGEGHTWRCEGETRTGNLDVGAPEIAVTVNDTSRTSSEAYLFGTAIGFAVSGRFAIDRQGRFRWLVLDDSDHYTVMNTLSRDGTVAIYNRYDREPWFKQGELVWSGLVGDPVRHETDAVDGNHHVFRELPDGSVLFLRPDVRTADLSDGPHSIVGDAVWELSPDGTTRELWNAWDHLELDDSILTFPATWTEGLDWTHGNALDYDEAHDAVLFSMANVRTVVEFDRATGDTLRTFWSGRDWTLDGEDIDVISGERFRHQHDASYGQDGHLLMSVTADQPPNNSLAVEYEIDPDAHKLVEVWRYAPDPPVTNWALGQVTDLANGDRLVATNYAGLVQEVTLDGDVVWEAHTPANVVFGQVYLVDDLPGVRPVP